MDDPVPPRAHLTALALVLHDVTDVISDIRVVRERARSALPHLDRDIVEDLLICAMATLTGIDAYLGALTTLWGAEALVAASSDLAGVLAELAAGG